MEYDPEQDESKLHTFDHSKSIFILEMQEKDKLKFQQTLEGYMEQEKLHDIFEDMMKALIKDRPKNPVEFLIDRLT